MGRYWNIFYVYIKNYFVSPFNLRHRRLYLLYTIFYDLVERNGDISSVISHNSSVFLGCIESLNSFSDNICTPTTEEYAVDPRRKVPPRKAKQSETQKSRQWFLLIDKHLQQVAQTHGQTPAHAHKSCVFEWKSFSRNSFHIWGRIYHIRSSPCDKAQEDFVEI